MLAAVRRIVDSVGVAVSADLESGYGDTPRMVAETVGLALDIGVAGVNLEDAVDGTQLPPGAAAERIGAARAVAPSAELVLNARIDTFLVAAGSEADFEDAMTRARLYVNAGADCIFLPGLHDLDRLREAARRIQAPLNIVVGLGGAPLDATAIWSTGVRRISVGGSLSRAAYGLVVDAALAMRTAGTFDFAEHAIAHGEMQRAFDRDPSSPGLHHP